MMMMTERQTSASLMMLTVMTDRLTYKFQSHDDYDDDVSEIYKCQSHDDDDDREIDVQVPIS